VRSLATRIVELDRGTLRSYRTSYDAYLAQREEGLRVETEQAALFDKQLAQEEAWVRQGIKARRTRNEGRVRALEALRLERSMRRDETGRVKAQLQEADRSGRKVLRCEGVGFEFGDAHRATCDTLLRGVRRHPRPNGCKTTLIRCCSASCRRSRVRGAGDEARDRCRSSTTCSTTEEHHREHR
jgi:ATP-binding cassette subfamily F protein uup